MTNIFRDIAGRDPLKVGRDIDSKYTPDGFVAKDTTLWSGYDMDRANLKHQAEHISQSESEVFAFLMHNTTSLEEARRVMQTISNALLVNLEVSIFLSSTS